MFAHYRSMTVLEDLATTLANTPCNTESSHVTSGLHAHTELTVILRLRDMIEHRAAILAAHLDRTRVATRQGRSTRELLIVMGCAPTVASRLLRVGAALTADPVMARHSADGALSAEHTDAVVRGLTHIQTRIRQPLSSEQRPICTSELLAQAFSGASPAQIAHRSRTLGNSLAADDESPGIPAAEDRTINEFTVTTDPDGRTHVHGDLDAIIGEKLHTMIDALSAPRPEPDGTPDARTAGHRRADALEYVLDAAHHHTQTGGRTQAGGAPIGMPKHHTLLTVPAEHPEHAHLAFTGPVSAATTRTLTCDTTLTAISLDHNGVPVTITDDVRLFPPKLRKALTVRDGGCCIKCGAPSSWAHAHHIQHWADGGPTTLDNGCLLCPSCHTDVHHHGWDVTMGADRHPWLIPPTTVDPQQRALPAYHRRTMRLDDAA